MSNIGDPKGSVLKPVLFIMYINDIDVGFANLIAKFAVDTIIGNPVISDSSRESLQGDLRTISVLSNRWEILFTSTNFIFFIWEKETKKIEYEIRGVK